MKTSEPNWKNNFFLEIKMNSKVVFEFEGSAIFPRPHFSFGSSSSCSLNRHANISLFSLLPPTAGLYVGCNFLTFADYAVIVLYSLAPH